MFKYFITAFFSQYGITIGGTEPHDIRHIDGRLFWRIALLGSLGLGDGYADGRVEFNNLLAFFTQYLNHGKKRKTSGWKWPSTIPEAWLRVKMSVTNDQNRRKVWRVGQKHYDMSNTLYRLMVGPSMAYSCGYWRSAQTLDQAQEDKYRLIFDKLKLTAGDRVLEIGCGWGGFARFCAERGVRVTGYTVSAEQARYIHEQHANLVDQGLITVRVADYRNIPEDEKEPFDAIASIGMFEHVGPKNYAVYMRIAAECLGDGGRFLLHTIVGNQGVDPFIYYRIFPGGMLPKEEQIAHTAKQAGFVCEDMHNFGFYYSKTLMAWWDNFVKHWDEIRASDPRYDEHFYRLWEFYLKSCAAAFAVRNIQLQQWVLVKGGEPEGYISIRSEYSVAEPTQQLEKTFAHNREYLR